MTMAARQAEAAGATGEPELFEGGPPHRMQTWARLVGPGRPNIGRRALLLVAIGWLPPVILVMATGDPGRLAALILDIGFHARSLVAAPLLVLAEAGCAEQLGSIIRHFRKAGLVHPEDDGRFDQAVAATRALLWSPWAELAAVLLTALVVAALRTSIGPEHLPLWQAREKAFGGLSTAGWWQSVISLPLLLILLFGWLWRLVLWTRLLGHISRFRLRLVASHPDHAAGLMFVGHSLRAFTLVALAISAMVAGRLANEFLAGVVLTPAHYVAAFTPLAVVLVLLLVPPVMFMGTLLHQVHRGVFEYGRLASDVGRHLEGRWLEQERRVDADALDVRDFSATAGLYRVVENANTIKVLPIELQSISRLVGAMALPFVPVLIMKLPFDLILEGLKSLFI
jgi:hypothetical protein